MRCYLCDFSDDTPSLLQSGLVGMGGGHVFFSKEHNDYICSDCDENDRRLMYYGEHDLQAVEDGEVYHDLPMEDDSNG